MFVNDKTEIGTLECRLSSNLYGYALNRMKGLSPVRIALNLLLSDREEVGMVDLLHSLPQRATRRRYAT